MRNDYTIARGEEQIINRKVQKLYYIEQHIRANAAKLSIDFGYMEITGDLDSNFSSLKIVQHNGKEEDLKIQIQKSFQSQPRYRQTGSETQIK